MTALRKYARLEAIGLWRPLPDAQRREVVVSFGDATLVMSDPKAEQALTHWSLAAVRRTNPGMMPAIFAPSGDPGSDTVEIDDLAMIEAIETVRGALVRNRPRRGRLRIAVLGGTLVAMLGLASFWLPGAVIAHTAGALPMVARVEVGRAILAGMSRFAGAPCNEPQATAVLDRLSVHLFGVGGARIVVLRDGVKGTAHLPGRHLLVDRRLIEGQDGPEVLAGVLLAERARAEQSDPLVAVLKAAGLRATLGLLTTGNVDPDALKAEAQAETILSTPPAPVAAEVMLERFAAARISSTPYALAIEPGDSMARVLIDADPAPGQLSDRLMPDADWVRLQGICNK